MNRLRTASTRRLYAIAASVVVLAVSGGIAQAALDGNGTAPAPKPLDRAVLDALRAPDVSGVSARIEFTNGLLPGGSLPDNGGSPLATGAEGRLWLAGDGRFRLELQSEAGDAQIADDGERLTAYDPASDTVYVMPSRAAQEQPEPGEEPTLAGVRRGLERIAEGWTLSRAQPGTTGGQPSYTVRIAPKDDGGLLGAAELAWDAARGVPLRAAVFAQGDDAPVLELEATDVDYGTLPASALSADPPADARVVEIDPPVGSGGGERHIRGLDAVQQRVDFRIAAPDELAGLPRKSVQLVRSDGGAGALSIYGEGMGAILVFQTTAPEGDEPPGSGDFELPQVNIDGATGTELATPLGTLVTFTRDGVAYTVAGSVPPVAAENAARGLR
jgi:outer membrane lipoprotein-sorting protein